MLLTAKYHPEINLKSINECVKYVDVYKTNIDGKELQFAVSETDEFYPSEFGKYRLLWKLRENKPDYEFYLYCLLRELFDIETEWSEELQEIMAPLDCFDQSEDEDFECLKKMTMILRFLKQKGFIREFEIEPDVQSKEWKNYIHDRNIGLQLLDMEAFNAAVKKKSQACSLKDEIKLVLESKEIRLEGKYYILTDVNHKPYLSFETGQFGGHLKLHIYGRLDCPSALRYLAKGQYKANRVFFKDEDTAIAAGFRPCGVCMKAEYKRWKEQKAMKNDEGNKKH